MRKKVQCEICQFDNVKALHNHHIIPRADPRSTDHASNLVTVCSNCHNMIHGGEIIVEGWFFTTAGNRFFWHRKGDKHSIRPGIFINPDGTAIIIEEEYGRN